MTAPGGDEVAPAADPEGHEMVDRARQAARAAAGRAGVVVRPVEQMVDLCDVSALLESVWGRSPEGVPMHSEVLRSLVHAGGCTTAAYDGSGILRAAAVLAVAAPAGSTYSLIAAVAPGHGDRGVGRALKLAQRSWALDRDLHTMRWTFDPLVARNARLNLTRLGAVARDYEVAFYGRMSDELNGDDDADRLVATWDLGSATTVAAGDGTAPDPVPAADAPPGADGPDGAPMLLRDAAALWCRVPEDIVTLRRTDPEQAQRWRLAVRDVLGAALSAGASATHVTRDGWYRVEAP